MEQRNGQSRGLRRGPVAPLPLLVVAALTGACGTAVDDSSPVADADIEDQAPAVLLDDFEGRAAIVAEALLSELGVEAELIDVAAENTEPGTVVEQIPAAGTEVAEGSTVVLRIAAAASVVPDVSGLTVSRAISELQAAGYMTVEDPLETTEWAAGTVVRTDPPAEAELEQGGQVVLRVAVEPEPEPDPTHDVLFRFELWHPYEYYESEHSDACEGRGSASGWQPYRSVALIGPDGSELSSATLDVGRLEESLASDDQYPPSLVCAFEVAFTDVPEVATYRTQLQGEPSSSSPSVSLESLRARDWFLFFSYH